MPNIGDPLVFAVAFYTTAGAFANPTISAAAIYDPSMTLITVSPTFVHQAGGFFSYTLPGTNVTVAGTYTAIVSTADATVTPAEAIGTVDVSAASGDPLLSPVPGSYAAGTAGYDLGLLPSIQNKTNLISTNNFTQITPVNAQSAELQLYKSDDYTVLSGRVLPEWSSGDWTAYGLLTAASITLYLVSGGIENALGATTALDATTIEATITAAQKANLFTGQGNYTYVVRAVLDSAHGDAVETLVEGKLTVLA